MKKVKVTVIKRISPETVWGKEVHTPDGKVWKPCTVFEDEQEFIVDKLDKPEKFCGWAWRDIYKDLSILAFGGDFDWAKPGEAITCCTDGNRPVIFKLERMAE